MVNLYTLCIRIHLERFPNNHEVPTNIKHFLIAFLILCSPTQTSSHTITIVLWSGDCGGPVINCQQQFHQQSVLRTTHADNILFPFLHLTKTVVRTKNLKLWTNQTRVQISTGLVSIPCVSWPKQCSCYYWPLSVVFFCFFCAGIRL